MAATQKLSVQIWSDIACPWCLVGKRNFETALRAFPLRDRITVQFRSFQLDPSLPEDGKMNILDYLEQRKGMPKQQVTAAMERLGEVGKALGFKKQFDFTFQYAFSTTVYSFVLTIVRDHPTHRMGCSRPQFDFDACRSVNTRRAHRLIHLARSRGQELPAVEALFKAYFSDGKIISSPETLQELAQDLGMELASAEELDSAELEAAVAEDIKMARRVGISGVPFFLFDERIAVSGGQPPDVFQQVLARAWESKKWPEAQAEAKEE